MHFQMSRMHVGFQEERNAGESFGEKAPKDTFEFRTRALSADNESGKGFLLPILQQGESLVEQSSIFYSPLKTLLVPGSI